MNTQIKTITEILLLALPLLLVSFGANALDFRGDNHIEEPNFLSIPNSKVGLRPASARPIGKCMTGNRTEGYSVCPCTLVGDRNSNLPKQILAAGHCLGLRFSLDKPLRVRADVIAKFPNPDYRSGDPESERFRTFALIVPKEHVGDELLPAGIELGDMSEDFWRDFTSKEPVLLSFQEPTEGNAFANRVGYFGLAGEYQGQRYEWTGYLGDLEAETSREVEGYGHCRKTYKPGIIFKGEPLMNPLDWVMAIENSPVLRGAMGIKRSQQYLCAAGFVFPNDGEGSAAIGENSSTDITDNYSLRIQNNCSFGGKDDEAAAMNCWGGPGFSGGPLYYFDKEKKSFLAVGTHSLGEPMVGREPDNGYEFGVHGANYAALLGKLIASLKMAARQGESGGSSTTYRP